MGSNGGAVYIVTNRFNTTLYVGVTSNLVARVWQHREKLVDGFTKKYNLTKLVYYELFDSIQEAITREKYIKGKGREFKLRLIKSVNTNYKDLYEEIV
jgi:putative endonuclease